MKTKIFKVGTNGEGKFLVCTIGHVHATAKAMSVREPHVGLHNCKMLIGSVNFGSFCICSQSLRMSSSVLDQSHDFLRFIFLFFR